MHEPRQAFLMRHCSKNLISPSIPSLLPTTSPVLRLSISLTPFPVATQHSTRCQYLPPAAFSSKTIVCETAGSRWILYTSARVRTLQAAASLTFRRRPHSVTIQASLLHLSLSTHLCCRRCLRRRRRPQRRSLTAVNLDASGSINHHNPRRQRGSCSCCVEVLYASGFPFVPLILQSRFLLMGLSSKS
jgi:hypothetical protein